MLVAKVGDQLVTTGRNVVYGEVVGVIVGVEGADGSPPFAVRWYDGPTESTVTPDPETFWVRSQVQELEVGIAEREH